MSGPSPPDRPRLYVLDQNFPVQPTVLPWPPKLSVVRLESIASELTAEVEDWEILLELAHRGDVSGFVTNDGRILDSAREMLALQQTRLALVVTDGVGHDALKAMALVMLHLGDIAADTEARPMAYRLRISSKTAIPAGKRINEIADHQNVAPNVLVVRERRSIIDALTERRPHLLAQMGRAGRNLDA